MENEKYNFFRDNHCRVIYYTFQQEDRLFVYSPTCEVLGWCFNGFTYNAQGLMVATGETPGILVKDF